MRRSLSAAVVVLLLAVSPLHAAAISAAKRALIVELMTVSNAHALGAEFMVQMLAVGNPEATPEQKAAVARQIVGDPEGRKMIEESLVSSYDRFSESELRQLIAFYKTDLGRKYAETNLRIGTEGRGQVAAQTGEALKKSLERSKILRTMADMRSLAVAAEAYAVDTNVYPDARDVDGLAAIVQPTYIRTAPRADAWGKKFAYAIAADHNGYRIVSGGPDGTIAGANKTFNAKVTKNDDIIFENGSFLQEPTGQGSER